MAHLSLSHALLSAKQQDNSIHVQFEVSYFRTCLIDTTEIHNTDNQKKKTKICSC